MTDAEIIKALEYCTTKGAKCSDCPAFKKVDRSDCKKYFKGAIDLINRQQAEIDRLELVLLGVMHFVDKWLDDVELEQDEINRASTMREKTLQIVEKQQVEIEQWKEEANKYQRLWCIAIDDVDDIETAQSEAIKEFAEELKEKLELCDTVVGSDDFGVTIEVGYEMEDVNETIDNLVKEMVGEV